MFKWLIHQTHWLLGITLGMVLPVVGITGAMMSFEAPIMKALSPGIMHVPARAGAALTPDALLARFAAQVPGATPTLLIMKTEPGAAPRLTFRPASIDGQQAAPDKTYLDPYTGRMLGRANGEVFFDDVQRLHRFLLLDGGSSEAGKHITAAAAFAMVFFVLSGLYLRWPRRALDWKVWLKPELNRRGRSLYWSLHAVAGTWFFVIYLITPLTGLTWAYSWYLRGATVLLTGQAPPAEAPAPKPKPGPAAAPEPVRLDLAWDTLQRTAGNRLASVLITVPKPGKPVRLRYLEHDSPHEVALNLLLVDTASGAVVKHTRFADQALGQRMITGKLALHNGSWWGTPGVIVFMLASAALPLFAVTGTLLYLDRRKKAHTLQAAADELLASDMAGEGATIVMAYASQTGTAEQIALRSAATLMQGGQAVRVTPLGSLTLEDLRDARLLLVVASTYGAGEPPDPARGFARRTMSRPAELPQLRYGLLALGDRSYPDFCGFGGALGCWLNESGARPLFPPIMADREQVPALESWRNQLVKLGGVSAPGAWKEPYLSWRLAGRRLLNPGSPGGEAWHVVLEPASLPFPEWQAGDIAEISPRNAEAAVDACLRERALDGRRGTDANGDSLRTLLARSVLPQPGEARDYSERELAATLEPLPDRSYSIASLPSDGRIELLVRKTVLSDGALGLGSGWLTHHAEVGSEILLRIRSNMNFHAPDVVAPMILIGAGTGLAGLRAHLLHRRELGLGMAWLLFGERSAQADRLYDEELVAWRKDGTLARLDLAFSRDGEEKLYVQDLVARNAADMRRWIVEDGASVLVCGGVPMAAGVHEALQAMLGDAELARLTESGRYRRDVY